ncbi:nickel-responsive transcriptional regulator NikR [Archaeoglobales archaeon]|nr:MAG: nickel-responsive transcriptional regulator NikR [Archaeoglobales archaeon]
MEEIVRISVSLPKDLLQEFDEVTNSRGYSSRSEAIRDAIRSYISEYKWLEGNGEVIGVVNLMYNYYLRGVKDRLTSIQHEFIDIITANLYMHSKDTCLEMILVKGRITRIKRLVDRIAAIRGVTNVKLITALKV